MYEYAPHDWDIKGYYGRIVSTQANTLSIPSLDGTFDVVDISDPAKPKRVTGDLACIGMHYALYFIANYGLHGHVYRIEARANFSMRSYRIAL